MISTTDPTYYNMLKTLFAKIKSEKAANSSHSPAISTNTDQKQETTGSEPLQYEVLGENC